MYCLGFVLASATSFSGHDGWKLLLGTSYIGPQAAMLPPLALGRSTMLIYILLDSDPARTIFPDAATWPTVLPILLWPAGCVPALLCLWLFPP